MHPIITFMFQIIKSLDLIILLMLTVIDTFSVPILLRREIIEIVK